MEWKEIQEDRELEQGGNKRTGRRNLGQEMTYSGA